MHKIQIPSVLPVYLKIYLCKNKEKVTYEFRFFTSFVAFRMIQSNEIYQA